jgi:fucose 4-O-acetylase-like acetyltransferase
MVLTELRRDLSIDFIKSIGILLVVLGHINSPFGKFIYSFHMPLFFIISGAFILGNNNLNQLHKDIVKLIVPTLVFFIIGYFVTSAKNLYLDREIENFLISLENLV